MAAEQPSPADSASQGPAPGGGRWRRVMREIVATLAAKPRQTLVVIGLVTSAVVGLSYGLLLLTPEPVNNRPGSHLAGPGLGDALAALDAGDYDAAREVASNLRLRKDLSTDVLGSSAYVLGVIMAGEAEQQWDEREQEIRHLLAARYLEEARANGFPPGRTAHGLRTLGESYYAAGRYAEALAPLHAAIEADPTDRHLVRGLLMEAYLRDEPPQYDQALAQAEAYLTHDGLEPADRYRAQLIQGEVQLRLGNAAAAESTLASIPATAAEYPSASLLRARILLDDGAKLASPESDTKFESARQLAQTVVDATGANPKLLRQAQYVLGLTYARLAALRSTLSEARADREAAIAQFAAVRRSSFDSPEGVSAALEEGELQQMLGEDDAAVAAFRRAIALAAELKPYNNPWTSLEELQQRVDAAYNRYRDAANYAQAIELAQALAPLFHAARAMQLQAETQEAAARQASEQAAGLVRSQAEPLLAHSRMLHREAAASYAQLGRLRFATRDYPDDIWHAAENYLRGQDYDRAVEFFQKFLETRNRQERPPALTALGESLLALNRPEDALPYLNECIEFYPTDPHSYRARIVAAQAHRELGNLEQAKALLRGNLEHESLTPRSIEWRESLFEIGQLYYLEGLDRETQSRLLGVNSEVPATRKQGLAELEQARDAFHEAIRRLSEAVQRDPSAPQSIDARYMIAESHRHAAKLPRKELPTVTIETTVRQLNEQINRELTAAEEYYVELMQLLNSRPEQSELTDVERKILRNCYFARADALYDMERYEEAIDAYSDATNRYQQEPACLEAYIQIANCHRRRNRADDARGALEQAKVVLARIRADADFTQTTRYSREEWTKLLEWMATL